MSAKDRKRRREQQDDVDIFEVGPATNPFIKQAGLIDPSIPTQKVVDIDPLYGGIQKEEDEVFGDQAMRDLTRLGLGFTEQVAPSPETEAEQADTRANNQQIFNTLISITGLDPDSFEGQQLLLRLKTDKKFQKDMGIASSGILTGGGTTDSPTMGLFDLGTFFAGPARKGLTTMVETGADFKNLPFEEKLGIAILPIDLIDVAGLGTLVAGGLGALMRAGIKTFGKGSKKTVKDLVDDEQFIKTFLDDNPNAIKDLEQYGFDIQRRFAKGKGSSPEQIEARRQLDQDLFGTQTTKPKLDITQGKVDDSLARFAKEAEELKLKTDEFKTTPEDFAEVYNKEFGKEGFFRKGRAENSLRAKFRDNYDRLFNEAKEKGLLVQRSRQTAQGSDLLPTIGERFNNLDFKKLDPKNPSDEIVNIINEERANIGLPDLVVASGKTPDSSVVVKKLIDRGLINKSTFNKIKNYNNERKKIGNIKGREEAAKTRAEVRTKKADAARELIEDLKKGRDEPLVMSQATLVNKLKEAYPDIFTGKLETEGGRGMLIKQIEQTYPEIRDILPAVGKKTDPETLTYQAEKVGQENIFAKKFTDTFREGEDMVTLLKVDPEMRFFNNLRRSSGQSADEFFETVNRADIAEGGKFHEDFLKFKAIDAARLEANKRLRPILRKIFDDIRLDTARDRALDGEGLEAVVFDSISSMQLAHKFKLSGISDGFAADKLGKGAKAEEIYLDISDYNSYIQNSLENTARKNYKLFQETQDPKYKAIFDAIDQDMKIMGIEGQVAPGVKIGQAMPFEEKLAGLMINAMDKGLLTQTEVNKAITAANKIAKAKKDYEKLFKEPANFQQGGLVEDVDDIFDTDKFKPFIDIQFGEQSPAAGKLRRFGDKPTEDATEMAEKDISAPAQRMFDVEPMEENMFAEPMSGNVETTNLILPFYKLFTKPPINETAPIPTPKESLGNPTKKQKQSLEQEKINKQDDVFDPTPEDNKNVDLGSPVDVAVTPKTKTAVTGVFYSDIERVLQRPDTPAIFPNKQVLLDLLRKNRIKNTEFDDYQLESLLRAYDDTTPIPKQQVIDHIRKAPIRGLHVHATGEGSNIINPGSRNVDTRYTGYAAEGFIQGTQRERVLYIPKQNLRGDSGVFPEEIFRGEDMNRHKFGIPNEEDSYIVGWTRLTDRNAILPTKIEAPKTQSKVPGLTRERERAQRQVAGLYAEAINKLNREGFRRGLNQADLDEINQLSFEQMLTQYGDTLNELSPGLIDQIDELIVKVRDLDSEIAKGSTVDTSGIVKVAFADEIQSDIMQAAAGRKQKLLATVRKIQEEGRDSTTLPELSRVGKEALAFFEENKSVFRPLAKSETEVNLIGEQIAKADAEIDEIISRYIDTRELDPGSVKRVQTLINENVQNLIDEIISIDTKTYDGLFPDLPFKKREEWADALIKKDLFELAYRKFILKDPDVPDYYSVTPEDFVIQRYSFQGNSATSAADRAADKAEQIRAFTRDGVFKKSRYRGIGMSEFYGGPNAKDQNGKHYTSVIEKILKNQAKSNNSEFTVLNVQTKEGSKDVYRITDQSGNMVATLSNRRQAELVAENNPNYRIQTIRVPDQKSTTPSFAIKITEEMLEPYKTHKAKGGLVEMIDIFEVA